jgi:hypothetical protein
MMGAKKIVTSFDCLKRKRKSTVERERDCQRREGVEAGEWSGFEWNQRASGNQAKKMWIKSNDIVRKRTSVSWTPVRRPELKQRRRCAACESRP